MKKKRKMPATVSTCYPPEPVLLAPSLNGPADRCYLTRAVKAFADRLLALGWDLDLLIWSLEGEAADRRPRRPPRPLEGPVWESREKTGLVEPSPAPGESAPCWLAKISPPE